MGYKIIFANVIAKVVFKSRVINANQTTLISTGTCETNEVKYDLYSSSFVYNLVLF